MTPELVSFVDLEYQCGCMNRSTVVMSAEKTPASRGDFIKNAASAAAILGAIAVPSAAMAEIDNPIVPFLGGSDKIDLNNANVRAYVKLPGM